MENPNENSSAELAVVDEITTFDESTYLAVGDGDDDVVDYDIEEMLKNPATTNQIITNPNN